MTPSFHVEPFRPARGLNNPHLQTAFAQVRRDESGIVFRRERLFTPDDDFVDIDFADVDGVPWHLLGDDAPVVLLLHGLEGSARRGYAYELYKHLAWRGVRPVGMNYRSCSGEMNWQPRVYHAGATDDVALVVDHLKEQFPGVPFGMVGISLGGGMLLKYLGELGRSAIGKIDAAVAISNAFDMMLSSDVLADGLGRCAQRAANVTIGACFPEGDCRHFSADCPLQIRPGRCKRQVEAVKTPIKISTQLTFGFD